MVEWIGREWIGRERIGRERIVHEWIGIARIGVTVFIRKRFKSERFFEAEWISEAQGIVVERFGRGGLNVIGWRRARLGGRHQLVDLRFPCQLDRAQQFLDFSRRIAFIRRQFSGFLPLIRIRGSLRITSRVAIQAASAGRLDTGRPSGWSNRGRRIRGWRRRSGWRGNRRLAMRWRRRKRRWRVCRRWRQRGRTGYRRWRRRCGWASR